jgi:hypothetical protein
MVKAPQQNAKNLAFRLKDFVAPNQKRTKARPKELLIVGNDLQGVRTVNELLVRLNEYQAELTITIYDSELGDAPVAFKREKATKGNSVFTWITLFPSEEPKQTTVGQVVEILKKCPPNMLVSMRGQDGKYSDLFLSLERMIGDISQNQWVVISDKISFEKYFKTTEPTTKELALERTAKEIGEEANTTERLIQGWLIKQTDENLFSGVLKEDRTIKGSVTFAMGKAQKGASNGKVAMVDSETVFGWIKEYFTADKIDIPKTKGSVSTGKPKDGKKIKEKKNKEDKKEAEGQFSLF